MDQDALARYRQMRDNGLINEAEYQLLAGKALGREGVPHDRADMRGSGAAAAGDHALAVGEKGIGIQGDNLAPVQLGDRTEHHQHTHHHAAPAQPGPAPQDLRRDYLHRLVRETDTLALMSGGDAQRPVRLGRVYTPLLTLLPTSAFTEAEHHLNVRLASDEMLRRDQPLLGAVAALDRCRHLVLLGGPGSGKSSFVHFVAQCLAGEALAADDQPAGANLARLTRPAPQVKQRALPRPLPKQDDAPQPEPWRHGALLPVLVVLRDLAAQLPPPGQQVGAEQVLQYLRSKLQTAGLARFADPLEAELRGPGALVIFDGLDEVPEADQRRQQIQDAIQSFADSFGQCRILVTCRPYAYQRAEWKLPGFAEAPLADFNRAQIDAFVQAWFSHMVELLRCTEAEAQQRAQRLLRQVDVNPNVAELAQRPLLLTLFARLQAASGGELPEDREALYAESVKLLLEDWEQGKTRRGADGQPLLEPSLSEFLRSTPAAVRQALNRLAFEAHQLQHGLQGTADIREDALVAALMRANHNPDAKPMRLREYLRDRAGILVEEADGLLHFPHRSFQEYLAACHLANDRFPDQLAALAVAEPARWREVLLLAAAHAARGNRAVPTWTLVDTLCPAAPGPQPAAAEAWGALLAGEVLVASGQHQAELAPRDQPKRERVRQAQLPLLGLPGTVLPLAERARAGRQLAALGDPRPEVMTLEGMQFCWVPGGPFTMGSDEFDDEKPQHRCELPDDYLIARYPVSAAQWRQYVAESGHQPSHANSLRTGANQPVAWVDAREAERFCGWLSQRFARQLPIGWRVHLPTEPQWEKAARGGHRLFKVPQVLSWSQLRATLAARRPVFARNPVPAREYPWGMAWDGDRCNSAEAAVRQTSALGCCVMGASPVGCEDMAGNLWEWTATRGGELFELDLRYPYDTLSNTAQLGGTGELRSRILRGWAFSANQRLARCATRDLSPSHLRHISLGFRVVLSAAPVV